MTTTVIPLTVNVEQPMPDSASLPGPVIKTLSE
jgi:hypothetical protein